MDEDAHGVGLGLRLSTPAARFVLRSLDFLNAALIRPKIRDWGLFVGDSMGCIFRWVGTQLLECDPDGFTKENIWLTATK
jgi:hypothetical protein